MLNVTERRLIRHLEAVRGAPYRVLDGAAIPCREISDAERLCKDPLVSVLMITFNHGPYIVQAVESILAQQCDFEFELLIGEDGSSDDTRAICVALQRKYPHTVRVCISDANVGGSANSLRIANRVRGHYVAFCEGDDYWIDPFKLKKQLEHLAHYPKASACVAFNKKTSPSGEDMPIDNGWVCRDELTYEEAHLHYFHTSTYLFRAVAYRVILKKYEKIDCFYDSILIKLMFDEGGIICLREVVSVYRVTGQGIHTGRSLERQNRMALEQALLLYLFGNGRRKASYVETLVALYPRVMSALIGTRRKLDRFFLSSLLWQIYFTLGSGRVVFLLKCYFLYMKVLVLGCRRDLANA